VIKTETFLLPIHWAPYLINGDASGYTDAELSEIDEWETMNAPGPCIGAGYPEFCLRGDDGTMGADRATFTFQVIEACFADGEVIAYH
jgi:hypothetical protein